MNIAKTSEALDRRVLRLEITLSRIADKLGVTSATEADIDAATKDRT